jgi:hypothetical protein
MSAENKYPYPDTSWVSDRTARRVRRVVAVVVLFAVAVWIIDRAFFNGVVVSLLWYVLKGPGPPGGF